MPYEHMLARWVYMPGCVISLWEYISKPGAFSKLLMNAAGPVCS